MGAFDLHKIPQSTGGNLVALVKLTRLQNVGTLQTDFTVWFRTAVVLKFHLDGNFSTIYVCMFCEEVIEKAMSVAYTARQQIDSIDVNSSGQRIVIGLSSLEGNTWDGGLKLLSNEGTELLSKYSPCGISMVRFSGPRLLLAARDDGDVVMYSSDKLEEMQVFGIHDDIVSCVADDPHNESHFASCGWDGNIYIWDWRLHTSKQAPVTSYINAHSGHINDIKYSPFDQNILSSVGQDGLLRIWDKRQSPSSGCASIINIGQSCSCLSYENADENVILVGTDSGDISVIDPRGTKTILMSTKIHQGRIRKISPSQAVSNIFLCASDDATYTICTRGSESIIEKKR